MDEIIESIKIDVNERYILIVDGPLLTDEVVRNIQVNMIKWWESNKPFCILNLGNGYKIRLERVSND